MERIKVHFVHGLESSPSSRKALLLKEYFDAETPAMDTSNFQQCVDVHQAALKRRVPDVLIGSSFGGAVVLALLQRGLWQGPTLLLAPAMSHYDLEPVLPAEIPVLLVHATLDDVVSVEDSRSIAQANSNAELIEVDDDHALSATVSRGELVEWVKLLARRASGTA